MNALKIALIAALTQLSACKITVTAPEGASVTSQSQAFSCNANKQCEIDVTDVFFNETFNVQVSSGFRFMGWRKQNKGLCGGSVDNCTLKTTEFPGNAALLSILNSDETFFLEPIVWAAPDDMPVLEYRHIEGKPTVRDARGAPIGSWQADIKPGVMDISLHFEGLTETYTARIVSSKATNIDDHSSIFFQSLEHCENLSKPFVTQDANNNRPLFAFYQLKGDEHRFYIADPTADVQNISVDYASPGCTEVGQLTVAPPPLVNAYPAIPSNFVIEFPLTIDGREGVFN